VKLIKAHTTVDTRGYEAVSVSSHADLQKAMAETNCDLLIMAAAVSDFRIEAGDKKLDRNSSQSISLQPTEDLVAEYKKSNPETIVLGFSVADSSVNWLERARAKRSSKGLEFLFANTTEAFDSDTTHGFFLADDELEFSGNKDVVAREVMRVIQKAILK
jgi:phosphopantothenoylcysteine synthetase/decarboxylase